jgi:Glycosyltransferase
MMKILIVGTAYPYRGGMAAFNERLAYQFIQEGHEVEIYTFTLQYPSFLFPGKTQYSNGKAPKNLKIYRKINSINPFNWIKTGIELRKKNADIVVMKFWLPLMAPCLGTIARIIRKNKKTRVVSTLDNVIPHERRIGDIPLIKYFLHSIDGSVIMSHSVVSEVEMLDRKHNKIFSPHPLYDHFGEKTSREEALKAIGLPSDKRYMLFFGFIRDYKGLELLMRAYSDSRFREINAELIVAGEFYNNSEKYFALERELGLEGKIHWFTDFVPDNMVKYFFCSADIVVQPYISATQSGVTQIGYHFEKPMLVTDVGGLAEIIPDGKAGYVVKPEAGAIADAILDFFTNNKSDSFTEGLKEEKKKYDWSKMTEALIKISKKSRLSNN